MSTSSNEPVQKKHPDAEAALHRRELSEAELQGVTGGEKQVPDHPEKPPGGKKP